MPSIPEKLPRGIRRLDDGSYRYRRGTIDRRAKTYAEAVDRLAALRDEPARPTRETSATLYEYLVRWLTRRRSSFAESTGRRYDVVIESYVRGYPIARRKLTTLTFRDFDGYFAALAGHTGRRTGRVLSANSQVAVRRMLTAALTDAVGTGELASNPVTHATGPRPPKTRKDIPSRADVDRIVAAFDDDRLSALYRFAADTGVRLGEALALSWSHVDLDAATVRIRFSMSERARPGPTKTAESQRDIPISGELVDALRRHQTRQAAEQVASPDRWSNRYDLVFTTRYGTPLFGANIATFFRKGVERSGVAFERRQARKHVLTFHDLRHAFATHRAAGGAPIEQLAAYLGHSSIQTTKRYYHPTTSDLRGVVAAGETASNGAEWLGSKVSQSGASEQQTRSETASN